jgi:C1A family cysteine protease
MKIKDLRKQLKARDARWTIPADIPDDANVSDIATKFPLGALTPRPGALTTRFPRMRRVSEDAFFLWQPNMHRLARVAAAALPQAWDWRNVSGHNWVSPPKSQGGCGSCVAFGVAAALESHQRIETNNANLDIDVSEAALFFINERQCHVGDPRYGWSAPSALDFLVDEGVCFEENYPYRGVNQNAELVEGTVLTLKITGYDSTTQTSLMKRWLCEEGPLVTGYTVYEDFDTYWGAGANGVYTYDGVSAVRGGHVIAVIGYDDGQSCWICKNSWGPTRGNDGCFRIGYGECGIDGRMYLIQDVYEVYTRDELPYNPRNLRIVNEGARGWLLTDGVSRMKMLDNKEDARNALRVARRHTRHGFIGRDNPRRNRIDYITEYWTGNSGLPHEPLTKVDCIPYNPANVVAEDLDEKGWRLKEGNHWMLLADDLNDALAVLRVVERHTRMCFIGRDNHRPNRKSYIMTYWE